MGGASASSYTFICTLQQFKQQTKLVIVYGPVPVLIIVYLEHILLGTQRQFAYVAQAAGGGELQLLVGGTNAFQQKGHHTALGEE